VFGSGVLLHRRIHSANSAVYSVRCCTVLLKNRISPLVIGRLGLKCNGTRAETSFRLSTKRTSPFKSAGASVQSTTGRGAVHISLQGLYCTCKPVFCSHVTLSGYPLHSLVSPSLLLPCVTVCHHISNAVYRPSKDVRMRVTYRSEFVVSGNKNRTQ
jgi:hypothetical protein